MIVIAGPVVSGEWMIGGIREPIKGSRAGPPLSDEPDLCYTAGLVLELAEV
jgi:hypothetical protein